MLTKAVTGNWSSGGETDLTGLTPSTNYSIAVAAVNEEGTVGLYSDPVVVESDTTSVPTVVDTSASPKTNSLWCIIVPAMSVVLLVVVSITLPFVIYYLR